MSNSPPLLSELADRYGSDKGFSVLNSHGYTRVYESLMSSARHQPIRILEIGLLHPVLHGSHRDALGRFSVAPSLQMWAEYLPNAQIFGLDIEDFSGLQHPRIQTFRADQSDRVSLVQAAQAAGGAFDMIIDDGSHASHHQQITLGALFPFVRSGGLYVIEDLHYQPHELELAGLIKTRAWLKALQRHETQGLPSVLTVEEVQYLNDQVRAIHFFDSLDRDRTNVLDTCDALAVLQKR